MGWGWVTVGILLQLLLEGSVFRKVRFIFLLRPTRFLLDDYRIEAWWER